MFNTEKIERSLLVAVLLLLAVAIFAPSVAQPVHQHAFADPRGWGRMPCALNMLSNLPFALWGAAGLGLLAWQRALVSPATRVNMAQRRLAVLFFTGLLLTAAASGIYHWRPDDAGLVIDRLGMVVAFAGLLGLAAADRASPRAGVWLAVAVLLLGPLSVWTWSVTGNVLPWVVVQFGGMLLVLALACLKPLPGALAVRWSVVIMIYAAAKLFEMTDEAVYAATSQFISGHSLKHVVASFAAWPVVAALMTHHKSRAESASAWREGQASPAGSRSKKACCINTRNRKNQNRSQA